MEQLKYQDALKVTYQMQRNVLGEILPISTPFSITLDTSESCNLRCSYCFRGAASPQTNSFVWKNNLMSMETFKRAVEQIKEFPGKIEKISLSGHGEPLCNRSLPDMVRYLHESYDLKIQTEIHTNGVLLTPEYAENLADANLSKIVISLQGLDDFEYYNICKTRIDFKRFYKNLEILYQRKKDTKIHIKIADIALPKEKEEMFYQMFSPISDNTLIEYVVPLWKGINDASEFTDRKGINKFGRKVSYQIVCSLMFYYLFVSPDGDVYPCNQPEVSICFGNISDITLKQCWDSEARRNFMLQQLQTGRSSLKDCKNCYVAQNSIMTEEDSLNAYIQKILLRMGGKLKEDKI